MTDVARRRVQDNIIMENTRIVFRNFSGKEGRYNNAGNRNFAVILEPEFAQQMEADGWNVKYLRPREDDDAPTPYLQVTVGYGKGRPPRVVMVTSRGKTELDEESVNVLDWVDIRHVDLIVRPYNWEVNGKTGVKAYLSSIYVAIVEDELELKYAGLPDAPDSAQSVIGGGDEYLEIEA